MNSIRQTDLNGFAVCPAKIKLKAEFGEESYAPRLANIGHFFHKCAEIYINASKTAGIWVATSLAKDIATAALKELEFTPASEDWLHIEMNEFNKVESFLQTLSYNWASEDETAKLDVNAMLGTEVKMEVQVGNFLVTGHIDRLIAISDTHVLIEDYKGKWFIPKPEYIQQDPQFSVYAALYKLMFPSVTDISVRQSYYNLAGQISPEIRFSAEDLKIHVSRLNFLVRQLEAAYTAQDWPYQPGKHCAKCNWVKHCAVGRGDFLEDVNAKPIPQQLMDHLHAAKAVKSLYWDELKDWVSEHGPVEHNGEIATVTQTKGGSFRLSVKEIKDEKS